MLNRTDAQQRYEMGLTPTEFRRLFVSMMRGEPYQTDGNTFSITRPGQHVQIALKPLPPRKIALLELPVTEVKLQFEGYSATELNAFMERFQHYFQRGGG